MQNKIVVSPLFTSVSRHRTPHSSVAAAVVGSHCRVECVCVVLIWCFSQVMPSPAFFLTSAAIFVFSLVFTLLSFVAWFGTILTGMRTPTSVWPADGAFYSGLCFRLVLTREMFSIWNFGFINMVTKCCCKSQIAVFVIHSIHSKSSETAFRKKQSCPLQATFSPPDSEADAH